MCNMSSWSDTNLRGYISRCICCVCVYIYNVCIHWGPMAVAGACSIREGLREFAVGHAALLGTKVLV